MSLQTINLPLPSQVYKRAQQRAAKRQHSIEDELAEVVTQALAEAAVLLKQRGRGLAVLN